MKNGDVNDSEEGTRHFMVNVIEPQFNLHSEEANVSCGETSLLEPNFLINIYRLVKNNNYSPQFYLFIFSG